MSLPRTPLLFRSIPPNTPHSVIQSLPTWQDNVDRALGKQDGAEHIETTYPRFGIHPFVRRLFNLCLKTLEASPEQTCFLFPSLKLAKDFRAYLHRQFPTSFAENTDLHDVSQTVHAPCSSVFAVLFRLDQRPMAMKFWTFSGTGISSRLAEQCVRRLDGQSEITLGLPTDPDHEYMSYYNSHSPLTSPSEAKAIIKTRFIGLSADNTSNIRGVEGLKTSDVYLYPTGMTAIWEIHTMLHGLIPSEDSHKTFKSAQVNVLYVDSYKLVDTTSSGYHYFTNETIEDLERLLEDRAASDTSAVLGIFTDLPGNPTTQSADLPRLRALGDKYHVPIIIDETAACHLNVSVLKYADIVMGSLTKVISGFANVLGGALLLNPHSHFYDKYKAYLEEHYEDNYFDIDAIVMELNSRGMEDRLSIINRNSEALADWLFARSRDGGMENSIIDKVFYPKYQTRDNYERCMRVVSSDGAGQNKFQPGYSGAVSITFISLAAAKTFYETISCYKGTTLGSVVTLVSPFTVIAFPPDKMDWARDHGIDKALVRFTVGVEDIQRILNSAEAALLAAEES